VLVDDVLRRASRDRGGPLTVAASHDGATLVVEVHDQGAGSPERALDELLAVADRVSALDGRLTAGPAAPGGVRIRAELPCG